MSLFPSEKKMMWRMNAVLSDVDFFVDLPRFNNVHDLANAKHARVIILVPINNFDGFIDTKTEINLYIKFIKRCKKLIGRLKQQNHILNIYNEFTKVNKTFAVSEFNVFYKSK